MIGEGGAIQSTWLQAVGQWRGRAADDGGACLQVTGGKGVLLLSSLLLLLEGERRGGGRGCGCREGRRGKGGEGAGCRSSGGCWFEEEEGQLPRVCVC